MAGGEQGGRSPADQIKQASEARSEKQLAAIKRAYKLAKEIVDTKAEQFEGLYRQVNLSDIEIAEMIFGAEPVAAYPEIFRSAIGEAARQILGDEYRALSRSRFSARSKEKVAAVGPEGMRARQSKGGKKSIALTSLRTIIEASQRARGFEPWRPGEQERLLELISQREFQHRSGTYYGKPDYKRIADQLNAEFHDGQPVRKRERLAHIIANMAYDGKLNRTER